VSSEKISQDHARELAACFAECAPGLFGYACVLTRGDQVVAGDLIQTAFAAAARHWPSVRSLYQAQRLDWLRTTVGNLTIGALLQSVQADTDARAQRAGPLDQVWLSIAGLPPQQHVVAVLRWLFGMKDSEITAQLGIPEATVTAYLSAVQGKLTSEPGSANGLQDELMVRLYQQVTARQGARYARTYDGGAGLARFNAWLQDLNDEGAVATAIKTGANTIPIPVLPRPQELGLDADRAVTRLYATHYRALVRLAALLVRDTPTAEEVVQDAIVATHEGWHRIRDEEKALAYLRQAVVNRSRSVLRRRTVADKNLQEAPPDMPSAEQGALVLLDRSAVVAALRELPDRQREAIVLRYYADLSEAQIAEAMGISKGAVKSHTSRGMSSLRAVLQTGHGRNGMHL
jgi:RNA polymerase sigma-70 factor (sigma-E family)